jgi:hypothetical protein
MWPGLSPDSRPALVTAFRASAHRRTLTGYGFPRCRARPDRVSHRDDTRQQMDDQLLSTIDPLTTPPPNRHQSVVFTGGVRCAGSSLVTYTTPRHTARHCGGHKRSGARAPPGPTCYESSCLRRRRGLCVLVSMCSSPCAYIHLSLLGPRRAVKDDP